MSSPTLARREFLQLLGVVGGGLIVGVSPTRADTQSTTLSPSALLQIRPDSSIHFYLPSAEMGQGVYHGLATLVAEELEVPPEAINIHFATVDDTFANPIMGVQITGGSTSMRGWFTPLRQAAADVRAMLLAGAAQELGVGANTLNMAHGQIISADKHFPYGDFVSAAAEQTLPEPAPLKPASGFSTIGKPGNRIDGWAKATGTATYGIDIDIPDMHYAVLVRCPVIGGSPTSVNSDTTRKMPGVTGVYTLDDGVAVVAKHYWQARQGAQKLAIQWEASPLAQHSSDTIRQDFAQALKNEKGKEAEKVGDGAEALEGPGTQLNATYWAPYLAHATMEPMNCTVHLTDDHCDIWTGTQAPGMVQAITAFHSGLDTEQVTVHSCFLGGGFGRRAQSDFAIEAVRIAKQAKVPLKLIWSREDDMQNDFYRPASMGELSARCDDKGIIQACVAKRVGPNIMPYVIDEAADGMLPGFIPDGLTDWISKRGHTVFNNWTVDNASIEGLFHDYDSPNKEIRHVSVDPGLRNGFWRSVGHSWSAFFVESFIDELAHANNIDPLTFRLNNTRDNPRLQKVIKAVAKRADWGKALPAGHAYGLAAHSSFESAVAEIAQVSVEQGKIVVHKVFCAVDCGLAVNPDIVKAQMSGGIVYGLSAALYGEITLKDGAVQQSNFHDYPVLRMDAMPEVDVVIVDSELDPTGVGEPGLPPIAPAVANAVFNATGKRLRELPFKL